MKRLENRDSLRKLWPVVLHRGEIEALVELIGKYSQPVVFESGDYLFDSLDEAATEYGSRLPSLTIRGQDRNKSPELHITESVVYVIAPWSGELGPALEIEDYLRHHRRYLSFDNDLFRFMAASGFGAALSLGIGWLGSRLNHPVAGSVIGIAIYVVVLVTHSKWVPTGSLIYVRRRHENLSVWSRYGPEIVKALISGLVGGIIGYFLKK